MDITINHADRLDEVVTFVDIDKRAGTATFSKGRIIGRRTSTWLKDGKAECDDAFIVATADGGEHQVEPYRVLKADEGLPAVAALALATEEVPASRMTVKASEPVDAKAEAAAP